MTSFENLVASVEALREDAEKFYTKGNSAAGTRLRKGLQEIKRTANVMRKAISEAKKAAKAAKA